MNRQSAQPSVGAIIFGIYNNKEFATGFANADQ
jgi:hypothetical protein